MTERDRLLNALTHVRMAIIADNAGAPVGPALDSAEWELMVALFSEEEARAYRELTLGATCEE